MKKRLLLSVACLLAVFAFCGQTKAYAAELEIKSKEAVLVSADSGKVLFEHNADEKRPIASMVKIMTLLLCFENADSGKFSFDDMITVSQRAASMGGSQAFLDAGSAYMAEELVKSIVIASANDSCVAMAEHIGGSVEGFVNLMNKRADELGMQDTVFVNCTGLPAAGQFSTAKDVSKMFRELIGHKKYFEYSGVWMEDFQHPGGRVTGLTNTNKLIRQYNGCDGGKTGYTSEAMHCLAATAKRGDMRLISVVVGGPDSKTRFDENKKLFDYGFANYESKVFVKSGEAVGEAAVTGGKKDGVAAVAEKDLVVFGKKGEISGEVRISCDKVKAPVRKGDAIGKAYVISDGETIAEINLLAAENVEKATLADIIFKIAENW